MAPRRAKRRGNEVVETPPLPDEGVVVDLAVVDHARPPWTTRVERVEGWAMDVIAPLRPDGEVWPIPPGSTMSIGWPTELGFFEASGTFREADRDVVVTWTVDVRRVERRQRRGAYRLPLTVPATLRAGGRELQASTRDVSEGGLRCSVVRRQAPERGDRVRVEVELPELGTLHADGTVVRRADAGASEAELAVHFRSIDDDRGEELRRFIFAEQLRRRNAGVS